MSTNKGPLAERLVYRHPHPSRILQTSVSVSPEEKELTLAQTSILQENTTFAPRQTLTATVTVYNHSGHVVPGAIVQMVVSDSSVNGLVERRHRAPRLREMVYLEDEVRELRDADTYLGEDDGRSTADEKLDLLLATQGWRR